MRLLLILLFAAFMACVTSDLKGTTDERMSQQVNEVVSVKKRRSDEHDKLTPVTRGELLAIVQAELRKHDFDCFLDTSQPLPPNRKGVVVPGCPYCKKTFYTMAQFI